jgi:hypothetical protein
MTSFLRRALPFAVLATALLAPAVAFAAEAGTPSEPAPAEQAARAGLLLAVAGLALLGAAGVGCFAAVLGVAFPRLASSLDRRARAVSFGGAQLVGALFTVGGLAVLWASGQGGHGVRVLVGLLVGVPLLLAWTAGLVAVLPLVGEGLLGARGATSSPVLRATIGSVVLALAAAPGLALKPWLVLWALVAVGWPVGVALATLLTGRRAPEAPPAA